MKIAIMQPTFNPWLGYFDLINNVDKFVFLDTTQLNQQSWQTRNKIKVADKEYLISIPIEHNCSKSELVIKDVKIDKSFQYVKKKLLKTISQEYKKSEFFNEVYSFIEDLLNYKSSSLSEFNINIIERISREVNIMTPFIRASSLEDFNNKKSLLVLEICKYLKSETYYSPLTAMKYLEQESKQFEKNNIKIIIQNYKHPVYNQQGNQFIPYMGIFDLLLNNGFKNALSIIKQGSNYESR